MKNYFFLILILLYFTSTKAQDIKTYKINDTRTYEVTATLLPKNKIIAVWMEARPERVVWQQLSDTRVAYSISEDFGETWSDKIIIDKTGYYLTGNPNLYTDNQGNTYLAMMHVGENFFSGELGVYKFNSQLNKFELKSIAAQSDSSLLDKPSITGNDDKMFLSYTEATRMLENSFLKILSSGDKGKTWNNTPSITKDSLHYLGTSAIASSNNLILSTGTYWNRTIEFFDQNIKTKETKRTEVAGISNKLENALSEIIQYNDNLCINWYKIHAANEVYFSLSQDKGKTWNKPILVSESGNLLSTAFEDDDNLVALYSEFDNNKFSVIIKHYSSSENRLLKKYYLKEPTDINNPMDYIGAFQKIIKLKDDSLIAFWIDFSDDNKLYLSKWNTKR